MVRLVYSALTLYMLLILLRWLGSWLEIDFRAGPLRFVARITDPLFNRIRNLLPPMGPVDLGPLAALFLVFVVRQILVLVLILRFNAVPR